MLAERFTYAYPEGDRSALRDLSLTIESGSVSATSSMSTPPLALQIMIGDLDSRSTVIAR